MDFQINPEPSPIEYLKSVSEYLGIQVWIKREDLIYKQLGGGSKIRKLVFMIPELIDKRVNDILTIGTIGSHHVNATAIMGKKLGIQVHAILLPQPQLQYSRKVYKKNKEILTNAVLSTYESAIFHFMKMKFSLNNKFTYSIPPGGTNSAGIKAYRNAGLELAKDQENLQKFHPEFLPWDYQVCIYGTGGITAGLMLAKSDCKSLPPLVAIQVYPGFWNGKLYIKYLTNKIKLNSEPHFKNAICDPFSDLSISSEYLGKGYGTKDLRNQEAVRIFQKDGIFLDPIYMARAGQSIIDLSRRKKNLKSILLWYTPPSIF